MKSLLFILNPFAGQRRANRYIPEIVRLFHEHDYRCELFVTGAAGDATRFIEESGIVYDMIVCAGGDGTLNETITGVLKAGMKCPLGYIPCGTTNDYASSIGLSDDPVQAARDIMEGTAKELDIGWFNGQHFVYTATCGAFAKVSYTTSQAAKNMLGHMAYVLEGMRDLTTLQPFHMHVETDEYALDDDFIYCSITNSTSVGGILKLDSQVVALNDGKFEVTLVRNPTNPAELSTILYGMTTMDIPNEMIQFFSASDLKIKCDPPMRWTLDGEKGPETGVAVVKNLHAAVRIMIPTGAWDVPVLPYSEKEEL